MKMLKTNKNISNKCLKLRVQALYWTTNYPVFKYSFYFHFKTTHNLQERKWYIHFYSNTCWGTQLCLKIEDTVCVSLALTAFMMARFGVKKPRIDD